MWNEEDYIAKTLSAAHEAGKSLMAAGEIADYEITIIDDASTDATPQLADEAAANDSRVKVVHHPKNRKLGGSIKTGFAHSSGDLILFVPHREKEGKFLEVRRRCLRCHIVKLSVISRLITLG